MVLSGGVKLVPFKLGNKNDVKIKQEVNLNLAKRDKQKVSSTSAAGSSHKHYACSHCGSNQHASSDESCPALGKKCNKCTLTGRSAQFCKTKASRIDAELAKSAATTSKNPRQCKNIQADANDSNEENYESSHIYSVAKVTIISI